MFRRGRLPNEGAFTFKRSPHLKAEEMKYMKTLKLNMMKSMV